MELVTKELSEWNLTFVSTRSTRAIEAKTTSPTSPDKFWCFTTAGAACVFPFNYFDYSWHRWPLLS